MAGARPLKIHLTEYLRWRAERGEHVFLQRLAERLGEAGWQVTWAGDGMEERVASAALPGHAMVYEHAPLGPRQLVLRRAYFEPFWQIEASAKRWEWDVARARFDPAMVDPERTRQFIGYWRGQRKLPPPRPPEGYVYVPLQGRLLTRRSFQSMAPVEMLRCLIERERKRRIVVSLHPGETYAEDERAAIAALAEHPRVTLSDAPMTELLPACDYVVTENSSVALNGFFLHKRAVLFAEIDFHHIAGSVPRDGEGAAFAALEGPAPDFTAYLFWFFQMRALNHWRPDFPDRLAERLRHHGWPG